MQSFKMSDIFHMQSLISWQNDFDQMRNKKDVDTYQFINRGVFLQS